MFLDSARSKNRQDVISWFHGRSSSWKRECVQFNGYHYSKSMVLCDFQDDTPQFVSKELDVGLPTWKKWRPLRLSHFEDLSLLFLSPERKKENFTWTAFIVVGLGGKLKLQAWNSDQLVPKKTTSSVKDEKPGLNLDQSSLCPYLWLWVQKPAWLSHGFN